MVNSAHVVVVDDDEGSRRAMAMGLRRVGWEVVEFDGGEAAVEYVAGGAPIDVLVTDVRMPGMDGYEVLRQVRERRPELGILMVTAFGDVEDAVRALKAGADDYLTKPVNLLELRKRVEHLLERQNLARKTQELEERLEKLLGFDAIIGRSPAMTAVLDRVRVVAPAPTTVLITGESGTGKELIANAIHQHSPRASGRFVALNCGAIPGEILEAELFGHERGAFTGAHQRRIGKIESAAGGTLFLDEISELSADLQVKLLRVLEERRIVRVGGNEEIPVDFRLLAATNRDLEEEVAAGRFRQDLYYRLKVVTIALPPLRERREDIAPLVTHFVERFNAELGREVRSISPELLTALREYDWPGNVRELRNVVENMVLFARRDTLTLADLPEEVKGGARRGVVRGEGGAAAGEWIPRTMEEIEREAILRTLELTEGHRAKAASLLGIGLRTLQRKLKSYGITQER
ncbi:MAG: sigma-54-dependent Fis family transcriptional regulator [Thermoanaerobaculaceae bacterium]|jgi:DNA-binding NtrC family response regulator|nr:sigma-54-dependent Fis family transcriptional regulator [Thermoanaerobaculaceae bacterium]